MPRRGPDLIGLPELERALSDLDDVIVDALRDAVRESAEELRDDERRDAPVDTGALREAIDIEYSHEDLLAEIGVTDPGRRFIAEFIENGTSSMPARPFAAPNAELQRDQFPRKVREHVMRALR